MQLTAPQGHIGIFPMPSADSRVKPHAMSSTMGGEAANKHGSSPKHQWIFSKEEMAMCASRREGMSEWQELQCRQQATRCIQSLGDKLNHNLRDNRGKMTQLCMCAAMIHMHRFFYFHSFTFFDYRDVAAACLFLAGKSEECPRKIDHIVRAWWSEKFPAIRLDQQKYEDATALLVAIESIVLQTICFDLQVALPHPLVLKTMRSIAQIFADNRKITEVVYFFSTDVLCVTSWGIRYSAEAIAVACIHIVALWANFELPAFIDGVKWFQRTDPKMTQQILDEMTEEFTRIYSMCKDDLALRRFADKGEPAGIPPGLLTPARDYGTGAGSPMMATGRMGAPPTPASSIMGAGMGSASLLPPPPAPPPIIGVTKKVDISAYKERRSAAEAIQNQPFVAASSSSSSHHHSSSSTGQAPAPRRSFMPDISSQHVKGAQSGIPSIVLPGQIPPPSMSSSNERRPHDERGENGRSSHSMRPPSHPSSSSSHSSSKPPSSSSSSQHNGSRHPDDERRRAEHRERERNEKRKREMSASTMQPLDKRHRMDGASGMMGGGGGSMPSASSTSMNRVPPPSSLTNHQRSSAASASASAHHVHQSMMSQPPPGLVQPHQQHMQQPPPPQSYNKYVAPPTTHTLSAPYMSAQAQPPRHSMGATSIPLTPPFPNPPPNYSTLPPPPSTPNGGGRMMARPPTTTDLEDGEVY